MLPYILAHIMCRPTYLFNYTDQIKEYVPYKGNIFIYLFVVYLTTLFSVTQDYIAQNKRVINEWWTGKDVEGGGCGPILGTIPAFS
jgi:hypothetical protein